MSTDFLLWWLFAWAVGGRRVHRCGSRGHRVTCFEVHFEAPSVLYLATHTHSLMQDHSPSNSAPSHSQPVKPWSAHAPQVGQFPSPFPRYGHALSTNATASGVLFIFGGYAPSVVQNDLYVISTRDFSTTLLQTSGETPSPRQVPGVALTSTSLLVWGGMLSATDPYADSLYLLNLGMSDLLMSRPAPADQSFLPSSIANVDPRRGQWSRARRS